MKKIILIRFICITFFLTSLLSYSLTKDELLSFFVNHVSIGEILLTSDAVKNNFDDLFKKTINISSRYKKISPSEGEVKKTIISDIAGALIYIYEQKGEEDFLWRAVRFDDSLFRVCAELILQEMQISDQNGKHSKTRTLVEKGKRLKTTALLEQD